MVLCGQKMFQRWSKNRPFSGLFYAHFYLLLLHCQFSTISKHSLLAFLKPSCIVLINTLIRFPLMNFPQNDVENSFKLASIFSGQCKVNKSFTKFYWLRFFSTLFTHSTPEIWVSGTIWHNKRCRNSNLLHTFEGFGKKIKTNLNAVP